MLKQKPTKKIISIKLKNQEGIKKKVKTIILIIFTLFKFMLLLLLLGNLHCQCNSFSKKIETMFIPRNLRLF